MSRALRVRSASPATPALVEDSIRDISGLGVFASEPHHPHHERASGKPNEGPLTVEKARFIREEATQPFLIRRSLPVGRKF